MLVYNSLQITFSVIRRVNLTYNIDQFLIFETNLFSSSYIRTDKKRGADRELLLSRKTIEREIKNPKFANLLINVVRPP